MKLHQQRDRLIDGIVDASTDLKYMRSAILRKIAAPYGDGSKSNMVNAETDVLPRLNDILDTLATTLEAISRDPNAASQKQSEAVRIW
jgi:hypothetical protein